MSLETQVQTNTEVNTGKQEAPPSSPPAPATASEPEKSLVQRAAEFKSEPDPKIAADPEKFDYSQLQNIKSPDEAKAWAEKAYKSYQRGFNEKFQTLAEMKKTLTATTQPANEPWSTQRVQSLLQDPEFVKAAQNVAGVTADEESSLSDAEKTKLNDIHNQMSQLQQQNAQLAKKQQDDNLKGKYANYAPDVVDTTVSNLLNNKVQATREDIWKVVDYDSMAKRAYEMGRQDERSNVKEKVNYASTSGGSATYSTSGLERKEGETGKQFMSRLIEHKMSQVRSGAVQT